MLAPELKADIQRLWDKFWSGGIANPLAAIEQIVYLIFMKRLEERDDAEADEARQKEERYKSIFKNKNDLRRWSKFKQLGGEELLRVVRDEVFPMIKERGGDQMRDAVFIIPSPTLLRGAVDIIDKLFITSRNADVLGDLYEFLLSEIQTAGKNGQFRTPRHIIRALVQMVNPGFLTDPRTGKLRPPRIGDPACGTAGFLVNSYLHILQTYTSPDILQIEEDGSPHRATGDRLTRPLRNALRREVFYGYDFDPTMVRVGWMNLVQHGLDDPKISYADSLSRKSNEVLKPNTYDFVLANPPFTGSIEQADKSDRFTIKTNKTELLFMELILDLLVTGGRAGVIVPEGVLFGSTTAHRQLREHLLKENQLEAVISLPGGVFQPYSGVKTAALVFTKGGQTDSVWFYEVRADGTSLTAKSDDNWEDNDLWDLVLKYPKRDTSLNYNQPRFREETQQNGEAYTVRWFDHTDVVVTDEPHAWTADLARIQESDWRLDAGFYKPVQAVTKRPVSPLAVIGELEEYERQIQGGLKKLRSMVEGRE